MNLVKDTGRSIPFAQGAQVIKRDCLRMQMQHRLNVLRVTDGAVGLVSHRVELEGDHARDRGNPYTQFAIVNRHRIAIQFIKGARIDIIRSRSSIAGSAALHLEKIAVSAVRT